MDKITSIQKGKDNTQIGEQHNYYGMTPQEASQMTIQLFMDNFPKLQEEARQIVEKRIKEYCEITIRKIVGENGGDFSCLASPDIQYMLYNTQKDYARFGTEDLRELLSSLISKRVLYNNDFKLKMVLNKAMETAKYLSSEELDFLSIIYYCKHVKWIDVANALNKVEQLKIRLEEKAKIYNGADERSFSVLETFGCLQLNLGAPHKVLAETYGIKIAEIQSMCPSIFNSVPPDYGLSLVGLALAILNAEFRENRRIELKTWIY